MLEPQRRVASSPLDLPLFDDDDDTFDDVDGKAAEPWYRRRAILAAIAVVVVVALILGSIAIFAHPGSTSVTYTTGSVTTGNLTTTISATGPLAAGVYDVTATSGTKIDTVDVTVGEQVTSGQTLATLDPTSLQDAVNQAQTQVNSAQTSLNNAYISRSNTQAQTAAQLNLAYLSEQTALTNCSTPPKGETVSQCQQTAYAQYNQSIAQANQSNASANAQVTNAQSSLASAQAALTTAKDDLSDATLTAPHAGTVAAVNGQAGGTVGSSGSSSGSSGDAFIEIVDLTSMQITAGVNEADIGGVAVNESATFTVSAYSSQVFRGTVTAVSPLGTSTSSVVTYPVTINVDMSRVGTAKLLPGMTASVTVDTAVRAGVVLVPASAITFARTALTNGIITRAQLTSAVQQAAAQLTSLRSSNPDIANDKPATSYVLERSNGKWTVVPIIIGLTNGSVYEVLWGLNGGETVVTGQVGGTTTTTTGGTSTGTGTGRGTGGGFGGGGFGGGGFGGAGG